MRYITSFFVIIGFVLSSFHSSAAVGFINCGSIISVSDIQVEGCSDDDEFCILPIGDTTRVTFTLDTSRRHGLYNYYDGDLINDVAFYVTGIKFNLTVAPVNPCEVLRCPLEINYTASYASDIYVNENYQPLAGVTVKWILRTDYYRQIMCFEFPVVLI